jgi:hypothetical protein
MQPTLNRTQLQAFVAQAVAEQVSAQSKQAQAATGDLVGSLRQEEMGNLARIAQQLEYLELTQNAVWKETQRQHEFISLVAHDRQLPTK